MRAKDIIEEGRRVNAMSRQERDAHEMGELHSVLTNKGRCGSCGRLPGECACND